MRASTSLCHGGNSAWVDCSLSSKPPTSLLFTQPGTIGAQGFHIVKDDFEGGGKRYGQNEPDGSPQPSPDKQGYGDRQGVQLQAFADKFGIKNINSKNVESHDRNHDGEEASAVDLAEAGCQGRDYGQYDAQVGNQAEKSADESQEIEIRQMQVPEDDQAGGRGE